MWYALGLTRRAEQESPAGAVLLFFGDILHRPKTIEAAISPAPQLYCIVGRLLRETCHGRDMGEVGFHPLCADFRRSGYHPFTCQRISADSAFPGSGASLFLLVLSLSRQGSPLPGDAA